VRRDPAGAIPSAAFTNAVDRGPARIEFESRPALIFEQIPFK